MHSIVQSLCSSHHEQLAKQTQRYQEQLEAQQRQINAIMTLMVEPAHCAGPRTSFSSSQSSDFVPVPASVTKREDFYSKLNAMMGKPPPTHTDQRYKSDSLNQPSSLKLKRPSHFSAQSASSQTVIDLTTDDEPPEKKKTPSSILADRFKFWSDLRRKPGESVQELATRILQDANKCGYETIRNPFDDTLLTRFVCSVDNDRVLKMLFEMNHEELDFARAVQVAKFVEDSEAKRSAAFPSTSSDRKDRKKDHKLSNAEYSALSFEKQATREKTESESVVAKSRDRLNGAGTSLPTGSYFTCELDSKKKHSPSLPMEETMQTVGRELNEPETSHRPFVFRIANPLETKQEFAFSELKKAKQTQRNIDAPGNKGEGPVKSIAFQKNFVRAESTQPVVVSAFSMSDKARNEKPKSSSYAQRPLLSPEVANRPSRANVHLADSKESRPSASSRRPSKKWSMNDYIRLRSRNNVACQEFRRRKRLQRDLLGEKVFTLTVANEELRAKIRKMEAEVSERKSELMSLMQASANSGPPPGAGP